MNKDIPTDLLPSEYELERSSNTDLTLLLMGVTLLFLIGIAATVVLIMSEKRWDLN